MSSAANAAYKHKRCNQKLPNAIAYGDMAAHHPGYGAYCKARAEECRDRTDFVFLLYRHRYSFLAAGSALDDLPLSASPLCMASFRQVSN